jgi:hypothetical protein
MNMVIFIVSENLLLENCPKVSFGPNLDAQNKYRVDFST